MNKSLSLGSIRIEEGTVEDFRPPVAIASDVSPQIAGRWGTKSQTLSLSHSLQKTRFILKKKEIFLPH